MNKFKSKTNIIWLCNLYETKARWATVFPVSESLKCLLLNEQIQIENECYLIMKSIWNWGTVFPVSELIFERSYYEEFTS